MKLRSIKSNFESPCLIHFHFFLINSFLNLMFYCFLQVKTTNNAGSKIIFKFNCTFINRDAFTWNPQIDSRLISAGINSINYFMHRCVVGPVHSIPPHSTSSGKSCIRISLAQEILPLWLNNCNSWLYGKSPPLASPYKFLRLMLKILSKKLKS